MPDTITYVRPDLTGRQPALHGFIVRRCFAANVRTARRTIVEACRSELLWSKADWQRMTGRLGGENDGYPNGPHESEAYRLSHEHAAARVLNAWGHLQPKEFRIREVAGMLRSRPHHEPTRGFLRQMWIDRAKAAAAFFAAVSEYRRLRRELEATAPRSETVTG